ncbi:hypothetical protein Z517_04102 [Fonsecaea pedrosoi CBS 271.37]|uniref:Uncharacterized protein n=1 Tax=Fonsecaea pedrosoi CBS 271.37 TaxID=1442368 RepID=A0A0D2H941_9EURO|nr:uncharacterized protein Z517_04102 [Fonsecaea pedrosoi CBS 271.37]KIW81079.1 hypothetical protein Z517_04102 [Fonsecaea pedrosoi CBS 271.37]
MLRHVSVYLNALSIFYLYLSASVTVAAADETTELNGASPRRGYSKGELMPVSCLNRTIDTGEHITDDHGNLQYIPFPTCNETGQPLSFKYNEPQTQTCTIDALPDELYHLLEFFVHSDVPLTCRVPSFPLTQEELGITSSLPDASGLGAAEKGLWTPFTIALQGVLQLSHLHLHTNINALFHMSQDPDSPRASSHQSYLIASTAYSLPNTSSSVPSEGAKIVRNEPLVLTFNVGWIDGAVLPGMVGRPVLKVTDHSIGFSLLSFFAVAASAGVGAMAMLVYERRKSGRSGIYSNGILGGNVGNGMARSSGYGGYGGYNSNIGKRD